MIITARFPSSCPDCGQPIRPGDRISWQRHERARHPACAQRQARAPRPPVDPETAHQEAEYQKGLADGERYSSDRKVYGDELAERFAIEDEIARFNRGEDY